jgi:hypothetical protein
MLSMLENRRSIYEKECSFLYNFPCRAEALVAANNRRVKYVDGTERKKASHGAREQGRQNLKDGQAKASAAT